MFNRLTYIRYVSSFKTQITSAVKSHKKMYFHQVEYSTKITQKDISSLNRYINSKKEKEISMHERLMLTTTN